MKHKYIVKTKYFWICFFKKSFIDQDGNRIPKIIKDQLIKNILIIGDSVAFGNGIDGKHFCRIDAKKI